MLTGHNIIQIPIWTVFANNLDGHSCVFYRSLGVNNLFSNEVGYMSKDIQKDTIEIGKWYKIKDFEHGQRPVKVTEPITDKPGYYWAKYSDGAVYDFHYSDLEVHPQRQ
jgi:hypothetical protein